MKLALAPFLLLAAVILALVGGGGAQASDQTVSVNLDEWSLSTDRATVRAGTVTFDSLNSGKIDHELLVVRTKLDKDKLGDPRYAGVYAVGSPHDHFAAVSGLRSRHITPGRTRTDVVDLPAGDYVLFCSLEGHYANGQRAALRVTP